MLHVNNVLAFHIEAEDVVTYLSNKIVGAIIYSLQSAIICGKTVN